MAKVINRTNPVDEEKGQDRIVLSDPEWEFFRPRLRRALVDAGVDPQTIDNPMLEAKALDLMLPLAKNQMLNVALEQAGDDRNAKMAQVQADHDAKVEQIHAEFEATADRADVPPPDPDPTP